MNTPRTKKPKRYVHANRKRGDVEAGIYLDGLQDEQFLVHLGAIATRWTHVEEGMTRILGDLLGVTDGNIPLRQLFRSVVSAQVRITILRNLLENTQRNADKGPEYDELIHEFSAVNKLRNKYVHGLWSSRQDGGVYFAEPTTDDFWFLSVRKAKIEELQEVLIRINGLHGRFQKMILRDADALHRTSQTIQVTDEGSH
jgi:hypothetical protein